MGVSLTKFQVPDVVFGIGALAELGRCVHRLGGRRPFVVTDGGLVETGWVSAAAEVLTGDGLGSVQWTGLTPNPKDHEIENGFQEYASAGCDVIVAIGGGSCLDAAKGVAILSGNGGAILDYVGVDRVTQPIPPLVMVPSTSGTGADVSQFAVVTDTDHRTKLTIISRTLVPEVTVIDPQLLTTMPDWLNAATGLDALTHAVEAFVSRAHNRLTDQLALHAVSVLTRSLPVTAFHPKELDARVGMAQGALEAGMAFSNAILGATHAMSHQVGGLLDVPHGVVNAVLLPHVIRFNAEACPDRYAQLAAAAGIATEGVAAVDQALLLAELVRTLADSVGVPTGLSVLGMSERVIPQLARTALEDACLGTNPRAISQSDIEFLFRQAL